MKRALSEVRRISLRYLNTQLLSDRAPLDDDVMSWVTRLNYGSSWSDYQCDSKLTDESVKVVCCKWHHIAIHPPPAPHHPMLFFYHNLISNVGKNLFLFSFHQPTISFWALLRLSSETIKRRFQLYSLLIRRRYVRLFSGELRSGFGLMCVHKVFCLGRTENCLVSNTLDCCWGRLCEGNSNYLWIVGI